MRLPTLSVYDFHSISSSDETRNRDCRKDFSLTSPCRRTRTITFLSVQMHVSVHEVGNRSRPGSTGLGLCGGATAYPSATKVRRSPPSSSTATQSATFLQSGLDGFATPRYQLRAVYSRPQTDTRFPACAEVFATFAGRSTRCTGLNVVHALIDSLL